MLPLNSNSGVVYPLAILICAGCVATPALAASQSDLFDLSLGELLDLEVTSVSKKSQPVSEAAAAVFVITAEDIRRSGMTTIPEILRMAPGLEIAQVDANKWAVSARGFQNRFANKLLVLMDGRTIYSPLFSGVFWDAQDTVIEDIERIEVIRGPGATLWGSNAVNGVVNIIMREASDSDGLKVAAGVGNQERAYTSVRYGGGLGELGSFRAYAKYFDRQGNRLGETGIATADDWSQSRVGFRADVDLDSQATLTLQGDAYSGVSGETFIDFTFDAPFRETEDSEQSIGGYNILARWQRVTSAGGQISVQAFADRARRDWDFIDLDRTMLDLDVDYRFAPGLSHDVLLGMNYRRTRDDLAGRKRVISAPERRDEELLSAFAQDEWSLSANRLSLVSGIKVELNDYTGYEIQPNLRLLWRPEQNISIWGSVARAVRTPGRLDRDVELLAELQPPMQEGGLPTANYVLGNRAFKAETLLAYETGMKMEVSSSFAWDLALFYNDYRKVRSFTPDGVRCAPVGEIPFCLFDPSTQALAVDLRWSNAGAVDAVGLEWAGTWRPTPRWQVKAAYSFIDERSSARESSIPEVADGDPRHQGSLRVAHQLRSNIDADLWLRYVDEVTVPRTIIDAYTTLDMRLAWRPLETTELSLVGRNLLDSAQVQFLSELGDLPQIGIRRSFHLQLSVDF